MLNVTQNKYGSCSWKEAEWSWGAHARLYCDLCLIALHCIEHLCWGWLFCLKKKNRQWMIPLRSFCEKSFRDFPGLMSCAAKWWFYGLSCTGTLGCLAVCSWAELPMFMAGVVLPWIRQGCSDWMEKSSSGHTKASWFRARSALAKGGNSSVTP